jgi:hypothetical protein
MWLQVEPKHSPKYQAELTWAETKLLQNVQAYGYHFALDRV